MSGLRVFGHIGTGAMPGFMAAGIIALAMMIVDITLVVIANK
jgi:GrpB-like predicted nucleotidyltransferase (UPF0157 family)